MERGQTVIDFGVGASIFLLTLLLVLTFSSSLFTPFAGQQEDVILKNRIATELTHNTLTDAQDPTRYVLDEECTAYIFENSKSGSTAYPAQGCQFESGATFEDQTPAAASTPDIKNLNITIEDVDGGPIDLEKQGGGPPVTATYGSSPPEDRNTVEVARRDVYIDGEIKRMYIRVWT